MPRDPGDLGPTQQRSWRVIVVAGVVLLAAAGAWGIVLHASADPHPTPGLTVGWDVGRGFPSCIYAPTTQTVDCKIAIKGTAAPRHHQVTATVTAYADENTSMPVGSRRRVVRVEGTVNMHLHVSIPVTKAPHVDEDGETACRISATS